jgi:hypothetical protein
VERQRLADSVKLIAYGYLLLHLNFNLGTLNVLPNWLGYILILRALPELGEYESSALLLRPLGILLGLWEGVLWTVNLTGSSLNGYLFTAISAVIALYFHFQLLTNLADIAGICGCPERSRILTLRTVWTVLNTLVALPVPWDSFHVLTVGMVVVFVVVAIWICTVLFSLRRSLLETNPEAGSCE